MKVIFNGKETGVENEIEKNRNFSSSSTRGLFLARKHTMHSTLSLSRLHFQIVGNFLYRGARFFPPLGLRYTRRRTRTVRKVTTLRRFASEFISFPLALPSTNVWRRVQSVYLFHRNRVLNRRDNNFQRGSPSKGKS